MLIAVQQSQGRDKHLVDVRLDKAAKGFFRGSSLFSVE
jgi:hypothetical protein